ncbi:MAG: YggT family protein [Gammaproteobacteria bacterium]|jgi:YggT family protein|nr:YggT family protein [Gammaproteobacteria bacterium]
MLLIRLIDVYSLIVVASVVVSWTNVPREHPTVRLLHQLTEPVLAPIRKVLPPMGGMDFSPLVLLIGLRVLTSLF